MNTYQLYLVADMVTKRLARVGVAPLYVMLTNDVEAMMRYSALDGHWLSAEDRERICNEFLTLFPDATATRKKEFSDRPTMKVSGVTNLGINWTIDFGTGVYERVQVGTKKVERFDTAQLATVRKVTVEEPVYEYRCPDPIIAAGLVAS